MILTKSAFTNFIIIIAIISFSSLFTLTSHSASVSDSSGFAYMDFQKSLKELQLKVEKAGPGIVMIIAYDMTGAETGKRTGFFIDLGGRIITNADIMKNAYSAEVFSESNHYSDVTILSLDNDLDLALIQVKANNEIPLELDFDYKIKPGKKVMIVGKSANLKKTVSEGLINSVNQTREELELVQIQTTLPISFLPSSKDGPLLNMAGKVIGITTAEISEKQETDVFRRMPDSRNLNAISIRSIKPFIVRPEEAEPLHPPKSKVWSKWLIKWLIKWLKTAAVAGFITLYTMGFPKVIGIIFLIAVFISSIQWLYNRLKNKYSGADTDF